MRIHTALASIGVALAAFMAPASALAVTDCGGKNERACCAHERVPSCKGDLEERGNCK